MQINYHKPQLNETTLWKCNFFVNLPNLLYKAIKSYSFSIVIVDSKHKHDEDNALRQLVSNNARKNKLHAYLTTGF